MICQIDRQIITGSNISENELTQADAINRDGLTQKTRQGPEEFLRLPSRGSANNEKEKSYSFEAHDFSIRGSQKLRDVSDTLCKSGFSA
jgi:hypothetical protein